MEERAAHLAHCNNGEYLGSCKYGEWRVDTHGNIKCGKLKIADLSTSDYFHNEDLANAHLIALSPKMAKLLRRMVEGGWSTAIAVEAKEIIQTLDL